MMFRILTFLLLLPCIAYSQISDKEFNELRKQLTPDKNATWRSIPWTLSVIDAQNDAAISKKPIFIWAMDGHPLGCV